MDLLPGDIQVRSEQDGKTIWINHRLLIASSISESYLWKVRSLYRKMLSPSQRKFEILPDNGTSWRWAKMNGSFYYAYDRIPNRAPKFYRDQLPSRKELLDIAGRQETATKAGLQERIKTEIINRVSEFYHNEDVQYFRYIADPSFNDTKSVQLAQAKAWCAMIQTYTEGARFKRIGLNRKEDFFNFCTAIIEELNLEGLRVRTSKSLRKKIHYFPAFGEDRQRNYLISGKYGNDNARKVGKFKLVDMSTGEELDFDIHQTLMFYLYMNPGGPEKEDLLPLWEEYKNWLAEWTTEEPISYRTFTQYCSRFDNQLLAAKARHGLDYYSKNFLTYVPSEPLKYAHSLFAGDGSATVAYKYYDAEGKCCRMNLYVILISDVASRYIAGWAPAKEGLHNETPRMVSQAVKMAIHEGDKQTMFEIVTDNHGAFTSAESKDLLGKIFDKVRTIRPNNSQANPAETQFRLFKKILKQFNNFLRTSWIAGVNNQANPDFIPKNEDLPTYEAALLQLQQIINTWNNKALRDGTTPAQRFAYKNPDCKPMDARQLRGIFGYKTSVEITRMRGFVDVWKGDQLYKFEIPDYFAGMAQEISRVTGYKPDAKIGLCWDADGADMYSLDGRYICTCLPAQRTKQAKIESNERTDLALGHNLKRQKKQLEKATEFEQAIISVNDRLNAGIIDGYDIAITDSNYSKEAFNASMEENINNSTINKKDQSRSRVDRDFDADKWSDLED